MEGNTPHSLPLWPLKKHWHSSAHKRFADTIRYALPSGRQAQEIKHACREPIPALLEVPAAGPPMCYDESAST
jgi:hypothetical protein